VRREVQEDPERDDHPAEAVDTFVRLVHEYIEERRVGQEDEAEDALPTGAEAMESRSVKIQTSNSARRAENAEISAKRQPMVALPQSGRAPVASLVEPVSL
jgi:hypothetical protein